MGTIANNDNLYGVAKWIVNPTAGKGTHTTIQAAITAASAGDTIFIFPGTYTENLTLKSGVFLTTFVSAQGSSVIISGKAIDNGVSVNMIFNNICLQTNSDFVISTSSGTSTIQLNNCYLNLTNHTGITSASGDNIVMIDCNGDTGTTGIGIYAGAGTYSTSKSSFTNSGATLTATTSSAGQIFNECHLTQPLSTSSTGSVSIKSTSISTRVQNATCLTTAGSGTSTILNSYLESGTASAISVGTGTVLELYKSTVNTTNSNSVTGVGTYKSDETTYSNTGITPNTSTRTFAIVGENGSWTPVLTFGGGSTNLTYAARSGTYTRIGNVVTFTCDIELSAKGISTGSASIAGLPYTPAALTVFTLRATALTFTGQVCPRSNSGAIVLDSFASGGAIANLTDTAFANGTFLQISGSYLV